MVLVISDSIPYFIRRDSDSLVDYVSIADELFICNGEHNAIRRHLLLQLGILED